MLKIKKGFTLIEMMVSVAIIGVITSVVLFNYKGFNDNLILSSAQQEISVAIRQAQIYGVSVRENKFSGVSDFNSGYGIYFDVGDPTNYYLFVDKNNDGKYDGDSTCSASSECVEKDTLRNNVKITNICVRTFGPASVMDCTLGLHSLHITYNRPDPEANIRTVDNFWVFNPLKYKSAQLILTSPQGKTSKVTIENTGQISVQ